MSWTISHGAPGGRFGDVHVRTGTQVGEWRDALLSLPMSGQDGSVLGILTQRRSGDPFEVEPRRAAAIASILRRNVRRMPRSQREMTETLAAAAERASAAGEPWRWS